MVDIKVKTKDVKFSVPIPYSILSLSVSVLSTNLIHRIVERWQKKLNNQNHLAAIPPLDKKLLRNIIHELKKHKGTELVYIKAKDGTEIRIKC